MINIDSYPILKDSLASLKETSMDDADKKDIRYMTESDLSVINFDTVKTKYANALGVSEETAKSIDALIYSAPCDVFVEFKNGDVGNCKREVKMKIRDSLLIFCDIIGQNISYTRRNTNFILVYILS